MSIGPIAGCEGAQTTKQGSSVSAELSAIEMTIE